MEHGRRLTGCMDEPIVRSGSYKQDKPDEKSRNRKRLTLRERKKCNEKSESHCRKTAKISRDEKSKNC